MAPNAKPGLPKLTIPEVNGTSNNVHHDKDLPQSEKDDSNEKHLDQYMQLPTFREKLLSWRWRLAAIISMGNFVTMTMRGSMSLAIVCMAGPGSKNTNKSIGLNISYVPNDTSTEFQENRYEFDWDSSMRGVILSATMYCGFFMPFIGGILSQKFGAKQYICVTMAGAGLICLLIPEMTRLHVYALIFLRFLLGVFTVGVLPASQDIWSNWAPQYEKVSLISLSIAGLNLANMFSSLICGFLCTIQIDNGWPFIFYIFGSLTVLWSILWFFFASSSPEEHLLISEEEKKYIVENRIGMSGKKKPETPWRSLFISRPLWAFVITQSCNMWCAVTLFQFLPLYFNSILGFDIDMTGVLLSIPFLFRFFGSLFWGFISDLLLRKSNLGVSKIRKLIQCIGFGTSAIFAAFITFIPFEYRVVAVAMIAVMLFFQSASMASSAITPLDIAPRFAGIITGFFIVCGSTLAIFVSIILAPLSFGGRQEVEWRIIFCMLTGVYLFGSFTFVVFGSSELQPWATQPEDKTADESKNVQSGNGGDGFDNLTFEIETPSSYTDSNKGMFSGEVTRRTRTISDKCPRTPVDISVAIIQPSEAGTPELIMKFPKRLHIPRTPSITERSSSPLKCNGKANFPKTPSQPVSPLVSQQKPMLSQTEYDHELGVDTAVVPLHTHSVDTSKDRNKVDTSEMRDTVAASAHRNTVLTSLDTNAVATSKYRNTVEASEDRNTVATSEDRNTAATSGDRNTVATSVATSEDRNTVVTSEDRNTVATSKDRNTVAASEDRNTVATSEDGNTVATSEDRNTVAASEDRNTVATSEDRNTVATSEDKNTVATSEDRNTVATSKDRNTVATSKDRNTVATSEDRNIEATPEDRNTVATSEDRNTVATSEDRNTVATSEDRNTVATSEDRNTVATSRDRNIEATSEDRNTVATSEATNSPVKTSTRL